MRTREAIQAVFPRRAADWLRYHARLRSNIQAAQSNRLVFWSHLGLGDQIATRRAVLSYARRGQYIILPCWPSNHEFLLRAYAGVEAVEIVPLLADSSICERDQVQLLARQRCVPILEAGHGLIRGMAQAFPELGLNALYNVCAFQDPYSLIDPSLREDLERFEQVDPPRRPYAFVDHHPGTHREIPPAVLDGLKQRDLLVVRNPRKTPLWALVRVIDEAQELHLVSSAPLCLALTIDARPSIRFRYREPNASGLMIDYPASWTEWNLAHGSASRVDREEEWKLAMAGTHSFKMLRAIIHSRIAQAS